MNKLTKTKILNLIDEIMIDIDTENECSVDENCSLSTASNNLTQLRALIQAEEVTSEGNDKSASPGYTGMTGR
jgi:hypothetical protein